MREENSKNKSSIPGCITAIIVALITATSSPWWYREFLHRFPNKPIEDNPDSEVHAPESDLSITSNQRHNSTTPEEFPGIRSEASNIPIDLGNLENYFNVRRITIQKGYQEAPSQITFIVESKGDFKGSMYAYLYDEDNVKMCPFYAMFCNSFEAIVSFETKAMDWFLYTPDTLADSWVKGEVDRASLTIHSNTSRVELFFVQQY